MTPSTEGRRNQGVSELKQRLLGNLRETRLLGSSALNNLLILTRLEGQAKRIGNRWIQFRYDPGKTLRENVGFAHTPADDAGLRKALEDLQRIARRCLSPGDGVLEIGCGTGLYLKDFDAQYALTGLDISPEMIKVCKAGIPHASFIVGDIMKTDIQRRFKLIYLVSVLEFINRSDLSRFFARMSNLLEPGGFLFVHYPHALRWMDTLYPRLKYIRYSPRLVEKTARKHLALIEHHHAFDERIVGRYDREKGSPTFQNSYLLVAWKPVGSAADVSPEDDPSRRLPTWTEVGAESTR